MAKEKVELIIDGDSKGAQKALGGTKVSTVALGNVLASVATGAARLFAASLRNIASATMKNIELAGIQERAEITLGAAMKQAGTFTEAAFKHNLSYASSLQQVTTFGDEAILTVQKMLTNFKIEGPMLDALTKGTLDLAAAKGMDLKAAGDLVAKSVGSSTNALTRYGITVEGAVGSTERAEMAARNIANLFGGAAQAQTKSYTGAVEQMENSYGDLREELGFVITKNKGMVEIFNVLRTAIAQATDWVRAHQSQLGELVKTGMVAVVKAIGWIVNSLHFLSFTWTEIGNIALRAINKMLSGIRDYLAKVGQIWEKAAEWSRAMTVMTEATNEEIAAGEAAQRKRAEIFEGIKEGIDGIAEKITAVPAMYEPVNEALAENAELSATLTEQKTEETETLIDLARGYTDAELEEYERRKEGLFNLVEEGKITREDYTAWVAANGAKFNATEKKTTEAWKKNWTSAWTRIQSVSKVAADKILKGEVSFGAGLATATKSAMGGYLEERLDAGIKSIAMKAAEQVGLAQVGGALSFGATLLMIPVITAASIAAKAALRGIVGFADGGMIGPGGSKLPLPSFESPGSGAAHLIVGHENEVVGTPATLAAAGMGGINVTVIVEGGITPETDIEAIGEQLGEAVREQSRMST